MVVFSITLKTFATFIELLLPYILKHLIDDVVPTRNLPQVFFWGAVMLVIAVFIRYLNVWSNRRAVKTSADAAYEVRRDLFERSVHLSGGQVDEFGLPTLISRMTSDSYNVQDFMRMFQTIGIRAPLLLIGGMIVSMIMDFGLSCNVLVEDPKGGADPHWSKTGRAALTGFIHFIVSKCEKARANDYFIGRVYEGKLDEEDKRVLEGYYLEMHDPQASRAIQNLRTNNITIDNYLPIGTWALLPEKWIGREACIAMILEWITEAQIKQTQDIKRRLDEGDQMAAMADPMRDLLEEAVNEARKFGYSARCIVELSQLSSMPDKERGSVLSTAFSGIGIFKNSAVVARTSFSDINFKDLRGLKDPITGEFKPISVYLSVNQVDARALSVISGTFIDLMSSYLIANPPKFKHPTDGVMGPFPALFVMDEFPTMPKLKAVIDGPAVGRGMKVSYLLIGQDLGQISGKYGKDDLETVISTTACKVILSQNNEVTAQRFSKMIGTMTVQTSSFSKTEGGLGKGSNPFAKNVNYSLQGVPVISTTELLSLPRFHQVVLIQNYIDRPIMAESPCWFMDKKMKALAALPTAPNVPDWIIAQREDINDDMLAKLGIDYDPNEEYDDSEFEEDDDAVK